jgi:outer membrane protein TolC
MGIISLDGRSLVEPLVAPMSNPDLENARKEAFANRSELKRLTALKDSAEANLKTAKSGYLPVLSGTASIGYADKNFPPDGNVWQVGLNLSIPIFSGYATVEQVKESVAFRQIADEQLRDAKLQINLEVESAFRDMNEASARIDSTFKEMEAAKENRMLAEGRYREGVGNIIEITDAQSQALNGETAHIRAVYDYQIALAGFNWAVGKDESVPQEIK